MDDNIRLIGTVEIDSGIIVITDPCNLAKVAQHWAGWGDDDNDRLAEPFDIETAPRERRAYTFSPTGLGDGRYGVYAAFKDDRVMGLFIDFAGLALTEAEQESGANKWRDMFPSGRDIFYEGDEPERFVEEVKAEFGFDPSADPRWGYYVKWDSKSRAEMTALFKRSGYEVPADAMSGDGFTSYEFHCPAEHLDAIYASGRWQMGS